MLTPNILAEIARAVAQFGTGILFHLLKHMGLAGCLIENILNGNIQITEIFRF